MAHHIFISYSSKDQCVAEAACAALEKQGLRCWIAPRDILGGMDWSEAIIEAIGESQLLLLVFSAHANDSEQVKREVQNAADERKPILPFRIENVAPSKSLRYFIGNRQWLDAFTPSAAAHFPQLTRTAAQLLERKKLLPVKEENIASTPAQPAPEFFDDEEDLTDSAADWGHQDSDLALPDEEDEPAHDSPAAAQPTPSKRLAPDFVNSLGMRLILVTKEYLPVGHPANQSFYVATACVTNAQYSNFVRQGNGVPPRAKGDKAKMRRWDWRKENVPGEVVSHPVVFVTHASAAAFCAWLTEEDRKADKIGPLDKYVLPTLTQWKALSKGVRLTNRTVIDRHWQPDQFQPTESASWDDLGHPLLQCLLGNVFEWCGDPAQERNVKAKRPDGTMATWKQECYLAVGGGWASGRAWLEKEIAKGTFGRTWCPGGWAMKDGGFRVGLVGEG